MKTSLVFLSVVAGANAFVPVAPMVSTRAVAGSSSASSAAQHVPMRMGLNPELAANFPRDFATVSSTAVYGTCLDMIGLTHSGCCCGSSGGGGGAGLSGYVGLGCGDRDMNTPHVLSRKAHVF